MGVHHYKIEFVPRAHFESRGLPIPPAMTEDDLEQGQNPASGWWTVHPPSQQLLSGLRSLLPLDKAWGETEEFISANDWGADVRIWKEGGKVWSITFRFSPVADGWPLFSQILLLAQGEKCLLVEVESGTVMEPDERIVRERLLAARAMQFGRDPTGTILKAAGELQKDGGNVP